MSMPRRAIRSRICGHSCLMKRFALGFAQAGAGAGGDEHADAALDDDQPFVLEALIGLGDGQRVGALLGGEGADRGKRVAVAEFAGEDRVGDRVAQADVNRLVAWCGYWSEASCCHNTALRDASVNRFGGTQGLTTLSSGGRGRSSSSRAGMTEEDEAGDPFARSRKRPR